jgi:hypothetical protein
MGRAIASGSSLGRVMVCPPSALLPRVDHEGTNKGGNALHDHLRDRAVLGIEAAMDRLERVAEDWRLDDTESSIFFARARSFEWVPPRGAGAEIALALHEDGEVRRAEGGRGRYDLDASAIFPATIDVMWAEPAPLLWPDDRHGAPACPPESTLWVCDYKTGDDANVEAAETNPQALASAVLAARWTGAKRVVPAIVYVRRGPGVWDAPEHWLGHEELRAFADKIRRALLRVEEAREAIARGEAPEYVESKHCTWCPAESRCPAKTASLKHFLGDDAVSVDDAPLTSAQARRLATLLPSFGALEKRARAALQAYVRKNGPITITDDGVVWGPREKRSTSVLANVALPILAEEVGQELADAAVTPAKLSRDAIHEAIKESHLQRGLKRQVSSAERRVFARVGAAGGLLSEPVTSWGAHRPPPPEPPPLEEVLRRSVLNLEGVEIDGDD